MSDLQSRRFYGEEDSGRDHVRWIQCQEAPHFLPTVSEITLVPGFGAALLPWDVGPLKDLPGRSDGQVEGFSARLLDHAKGLVLEAPTLEISAHPRLL